MNTKFTLCAVAISTILSSQHVLASTTTTTEDVEVITVKGEKINRNLQKTTSSVGVITQQTLEDKPLFNIKDAYGLLANVRDSDWVDSGIIIRGINSEGVGGPAGSPLATLYIDGIAQTREGARRGALGTWDVGQVEVFRGPQSTISGRNSLAGAVYINTKDPIFDKELAFKAGIGNNHLRNIAVMGNTDISDSLALRVSAERITADGQVDYPTYQDFPFVDERQNEEYWQFRTKALWAPQGDSGLQAVLTFSNSYDSPWINDVDGPSAGVDYFDRTWGAQSVPVFVAARSVKNQQVGLDISYPLSSTTTLNALLSRVDTDTNRPSVDGATTGALEDTETAQEIRLNYSKDSIDAVFGVYFNQFEVLSTRDQKRPWEDFVRVTDVVTNVDNQAVFGEVNWSITTDLTLIAGFRYDSEEQDFLSKPVRVGADGTLVSSSTDTASAKYSEFLPKIGAQYTLSATQNLGLTIQKGYRAGGSAINAVTDEAYEYAPETATNFEFSYRSTFNNGDSRFNVNVFYLDWEDQQINVPQIPGDFLSDIIINAGESTIKGTEIEFSHTFTDNLSMYSSFGYAKTEFTDFAFVQFGSELDLSGSEFPQAPQLNGAIGVQYENQQGFFTAVDVLYTDDTLSRSLLEGIAADTLPSYTLINLQTGYRINDTWTVTAWADNLFDKDYFLYRYNDPGFQLASVGSERQFGLMIQANY